MTTCLPVSLRKEMKESIVSHAHVSKSTSQRERRAGNTSCTPLWVDSSRASEISAPSSSEVHNSRSCTQWKGSNIRSHDAGFDSPGNLIGERDAEIASCSPPDMSGDSRWQ